MSQRLSMAGGAGAGQPTFGRASGGWPDPAPCPDAASYHPSSMRTLIYHDIARRDERESIGFPGPTANRYKLDPGDFEAHLDALAATGLSVGTYEGKGTMPALVISFDDGGISALAAADALERFGWRGQFFITTGRLDTPGFMSRDDLHELARRGHGIGAHTHTHPLYMSRLTRCELDEEWTRSRAILHEVLGAAPLTAAVPGGQLSNQVVMSAAAAGFEVLFTSEPTARLVRRELLVVGRFTVRAHTPARVVAACARGDRLVGAGQWSVWNAKKLSKRMAPRGYEELRRAWARRR